MLERVNLDSMADGLSIVIKTDNARPDVFVDGQMLLSVLEYFSSICDAVDIADRVHIANTRTHLHLELVDVSKTFIYKIPLMCETTAIIKRVPVSLSHLLYNIRNALEASKFAGADIEFKSGNDYDLIVSNQMAEYHSAILEFDCPSLNDITEANKILEFNLGGTALLYSALMLHNVSRAPVSVSVSLDKREVTDYLKFNLVSGSKSMYNAVLATKTFSVDLNTQSANKPTFKFNADTINQFTFTLSSRFFKCLKSFAGYLHNSADVIFATTEKSKLKIKVNSELTREDGSELPQLVNTAFEYPLDIDEHSQTDTLPTFNDKYSQSVKLDRYALINIVTALKYGFITIVLRDKKLHLIGYKAISKELDVDTDLTLSFDSVPTMLLLDSLNNLEGVNVILSFNSSKDNRALKIVDCHNTAFEIKITE